MIYNQFDIVVVPFPFTDKTSSKRRPALILSNHSFQKKINQYLMAMITSLDNEAWPLDTKIEDLENCGLTAKSKVRLKLFTLDASLIIRKAGSLSKKDIAHVKENLDTLIK